ncbi:MAG: hypothetical protein M0T80_06375 [Actinomycetota bacterium]|nr:hypothetical protein [Actinomycetota bacterium]
MRMLILALGIFVATFMIISFGRVLESARERRRQRAADAETRRNRARENPQDILFRHRTAMDNELAPVRAKRNTSQRKLNEAVAAKEARPDVKHKGVGKYARVGAAILMPVIWAGGTALAIATFVALNNGAVSPAAVLKGVVAGLIELLLSLGIANIFEQRQQPKNLRWQAQAGLLFALLTVTVSFLAVYSAARSAQRWDPVIDFDRRLVASDRQIGNGVAVVAAEDKLSTDLTRRRHAEESDEALAVAIPLIEVATGELTLEGFGILAEDQRRRSADRDERRHRDSIDESSRREEEIGARHTRAALAELTDLGVTDLSQYFPPRPAPRALPAGPTGPEPAPPSGPTPPEDRHEEPSRNFYLGDLAPAREPRDGGAWDLAGPWDQPGAGQAGGGEADRPTSGDDEPDSQNNE